MGLSGDENLGVPAKAKGGIVHFPLLPKIARTDSGPNVPTPQTDKLEKESARLNSVSAYKSSFDFSPIRGLETRFASNPIRGGIVKHSPLKLVNYHHTCQQCLYALELDTYGRGCTHNCVYCYAKAELTVHGYWNNPIPAPIDINEIRKIFYTVFETDKKSKWRSVLNRKVPIRIGSMSDSFMWMDLKFKVTQEMLRILKFYRYPYVVMTRSDLVADEKYMSLMDPTLGAIQISLASINEELTKAIEPGTPSAQRRLIALETLVSNGFSTSVRVNPIFPTHPDGYFTDPDFTWKGQVPSFEFTTVDIIDAIAKTGSKSIIAGFGRFSGFALNQIKKVSGFDLRPFFRRDLVYKTKRDFHFSEREIGHYYTLIHERCRALGLAFSVCYIGNGEDHFWKYQDLWTNKKDCCNVKGLVASFKSDCRQISFAERLKIAGKPSGVQTSTRLDEELGVESPVPFAMQPLDVQPQPSA